MKILDFSDKNLYLFGDLHENFKLLISALRQNLRCKDKEHPSSEEMGGFSSFERFLRNQRRGKEKCPFVHDVVFCVLGDNAFGMCKDAFYEHFLNTLQELLAANNSYLLFIRGNHDDPSFFKEETKKFDYDRIIFVEDYTVLKTKSGTSLCVGGATSTDKVWRLATMERINRFKKTYKRTIWWEDEDVYLNADIIKDLKDNDIKIDSLLTHAFPFDLLPKILKSNAVKVVEDWSAQDDTLKERVAHESSVFKDLVALLAKDGHHISWWAHGHYHKGALTPLKLTEDYPKKTLLISLNEMKADIRLGSNGDVLSKGYYDTSRIANDMEYFDLVDKKEGVDVAKESIKMALNDLKEILDREEWNDTVGGNLCDYIF